ncbi:MAG TPA: flavodoxin family protein [Candidatus Latescibacteria bacterium]|nr:flavodoxin family protein [Candidatus Latescibacterota bacterium]
MNILILDGGPRDGRGETCRTIREAVEKGSRIKGWNVTAFDLDGMAIKPCRGCFACWLKHPGTCAIKDDEELILKAMVASDVQVWITPVTFGGYSAALKKALDRFIPISLPFFTRRQGEVHHPLRYEKRPLLLALGTIPSPDAEAERIFHGLVRRNAINLDAARSDSHVFHEGAEAAGFAGRIKELLDAAKEAL